MSNRRGNWLGRAAGHLVLLAFALAIALALTNVLVPIDISGGARIGEEKNRFYNRLILQQLIWLPLWIGAYWVLHKLYGRWRNRHR